MNTYLLTGKVPGKGGSMVFPSRIQITGPLADHVYGFWSVLLKQGYTRRSGVGLLHLAAHLSRWMEEMGLDPDELSPARIEEFVQHRQQVGYTHNRSQRSLESLLEYLRAAGVLRRADDTAEVSTPLEQLLYQYKEYLRHERAVSSTTVSIYGEAARRFLSNRFGSRPIDARSISAADLSAYVLHQSRRYTVSSAKVTVTALRSFLRFLHVHGDLTTDLTGAVPAVAGWRLASLPKTFTSDEMRHLLRSCDRRTSVGRRDFAILLVLSRLGLRAGEVAALELHDLHWVRGELVVRGKGQRENLLPIPDDVGKAMVAYLRRSRPRKPLRDVFLTVRAPYRGLSSSAVSCIVCRACKRAGLPPAGAHRLRHTAATHMLRQGVRLPDIGQVLRHRSIGTTAIYTKVDLAALRNLAQPWPGGAP